MLMVKADEKNGIFRGHMSILQQYNRAYELPEVRGASWMRGSLNREENEGSQG